ncbi:hypothetical protein [Burkholderia ubonensis]|uniref:hypothetical protein n=1 Tax=Burkholderia ubonensis TaxID=101571 RepID=UPI000751CE98|nr:hypothetical protein [Burkholderia ubonensis]KVL24459.1 hypothetical protein WJ45_23020 [Burkholderia ubonensis]KVQ37736.1 hypothetical protein WK04_24545 [Burkholderia ubonensis]KWC51561.1 hypothetical protein WL53_02040 [Burkholderia ubonensis]KWD56698.1 hypothetical protein WL67_11555 [Burkholderia ubonensis]KWD61639.1 hypothetical protein WL66_33555 [Burkholderia ubonensis]
MLDALCTKTDDYKAASRIGAEAAADFVAALQASPQLAGLGLLPRIALYIESNDCSAGIGPGFFGAIDKLLLRSARADALSARTIIRSLTPARDAAKDTHESSASA